MNDVMAHMFMVFDREKKITRRKEKKNKEMKNIKVFITKQNLFLNIASIVSISIQEEIIDQ